MKKTVVFVLLVLPALLLASGADAESSRYFTQTGRETDFLPRVVNFTIFAALLYYLVANPVKSFFKGRTQGIAMKLSEIENKLQAAKEEQKEAQNRLEKNEEKARKIIADAKAEAILLADKIAQANANDLALLQKQFQEKIAQEERRVAREMIDKVLSENISNDDIMIDGTKVVEIISKKVA